MSERQIIEGLLIKADVVDSQGDYIPRDVLEKAVAESKLAQHGFATVGFSNKPEDIVGSVQKLEMKEDGAYVSVEVMDTPAGARVQRALEVRKSMKKSGIAVDELVPAVGGVIHKKHTEERDGKKITVIDKIGITSVALIPESQKVK